MLELLKAMEKAGKWAEIMAMAPVIKSTLQGDDLALALLRLSKAHEETAVTPAAYRIAVDYAVQSVAAAVPGSWIHTWSSARAATMQADIGRFTEAQRHADVFFAQIANHPKAAVMTPWAHYAVARALYYHRQPVQALARLHQAMDAGADGALSELVQIWTSWCLATAGRAGAAFAAIPTEVHYTSPANLLAATARACLAAQDWAGSQLNARLALQAYDAGAISPDNSIQAAELYLILKQAADRLGRHDQGAVWLNKTAALLSPECEALLFLLVPSLGTKGGVYFEAASSVRGDSDGHKRSGLRGTVG